MNKIIKHNDFEYFQISDKKNPRSLNKIIHFLYANKNTF